MSLEENSRLKTVLRLGGAIGTALSLATCLNVVDITGKNSEAVGENSSRSDHFKSDPEAEKFRNRVATVIKALLTPEAKSDEDEKFPGAYLPEDLSTKDEYLLEAVDCLEASGDFTCIMQSSYGRFHCLPVDGSAENLRPVELEQSGSINFDTSERKLLPQITLWNGSEHGKFDFDRNSFYENREEFCANMLEWVYETDSNPEELCKKIYNDAELPECYVFGDAWKDFALNNSFNLEYSDWFRDELDASGLEFIQESNSTFAVVIDGVEYPLAVVSDRPVMGVENFDPDVHIAIMNRSVDWPRERYGVENPKDMIDFLVGLENSEDE